MRGWMDARRLLFCDKLVLRVVLPRRCLRWVLTFLVQSDTNELQPSESPTTAHRAVECMLPLVETWADPDFIRQADPKLQACKSDYGYRTDTKKTLVTYRFLNILIKKPIDAGYRFETSPYMAIRTV